MDAVLPGDLARCLLPVKRFEHKTDLHFGEHGFLPMAHRSLLGGPVHSLLGSRQRQLRMAARSNLQGS